jgi:hypothetical protein
MNLARRIRLIFAFFCLFVLGGCASPFQDPVRVSHAFGWQWSVVPTEKFDIETARPPGRQGDILWVFIEGDGLAYITPDRPSSDPTPSDPIGLRLALAQPSIHPVAYVARPCQYVLPKAGRNCKRDYWTGARYSPDVIRSITYALDVLKTQTGAQRLVLVGYSGGGAVAVLSAAERHDIAAIVTIAANLDMALWIQEERLAPLSGSLDPANVAFEIGSIPQIHFSGELDDIVAPFVTRAFMERLPAGAPARLVEVAGFTHTCCWVEKWSELLRRPDVQSILAEP